MLVGRQEPVEFLNYEKEGEEEFDGFDPFLYSYLVDTRDLMLITLKNRRLPVENRMMLMLGMAHDLEERVCMGEYCQKQECAAGNHQRGDGT